MKRTQVNFAIDGAAFAAFLLLLSTGLLLRYQLPAGSGGLHAVGTGRGAAQRPVTVLWGWTRHDWGEIHYWIAGLLIAILAVHLILHWKWIVCVLRGARGDASGLRFGLGLVSILALLVVAAVPVMAPSERVTRAELQQQQSAAESNAFEVATDLRGSMSLAEVADAANISVSELISKLSLPGHVKPHDRIGPLLRQYGLQMSDMRRILGADQYTATKETEP